MEVRKDGAGLHLHSAHSGRNTINHVARGLGLEELSAQLSGNDGWVTVEASVLGHGNFLRGLPRAKRADQLLNRLSFQEGMVYRIDQESGIGRNPFERAPERTDLAALPAAIHHNSCGAGDCATQGLCVTTEDD